MMFAQKNNLNDVTHEDWNKEKSPTKIRLARAATAGVFIVSIIAIGMWLIELLKIFK